MIELIIRSYFVILCSIGLSALFVFGLGLYFLFRKKPAQKLPAKLQEVPTEKRPIHISSADINAIAGDDVLATQLDLARAYIETGREKLAQKILQHVVEHGSDNQQQEARQLLSTC